MTDVHLRAQESRGTSSGVLHERALELLTEVGAGGALVVDVGCGTAVLRERLIKLFGRYVGVDVVRHPGLSLTVEFVQADLDAGRFAVPDEAADAVVSIETIEHLENPRAFMRELRRIAKPGAWILISTPNQLSLLSKLTLLTKNQFNAFQERDYPAHITALLEPDLLRIASEAGLRDARVGYSLQGRVPLSGRHFPGFAARLFPRALSDNLFLLARR